MTDISCQYDPPRPTAVQEEQNAMKRSNWFAIFAAALVIYVVSVGPAQAKEFGLITNDPRFPGTESHNGQLTGFWFYDEYNDARTAMEQHGDVLDLVYGFAHFWWQVSYVPLPHPDTIRAHQNRYPASDSEVQMILNFVNEVGYSNPAGGFSMIIQMEGGQTFAAADNDLFARLGLPGAHQTGDSSDAVVSFPEPNHPLVTALTNPPLWAPLHSFTWKGVGRLDRLDPKMECLAADENGQCILACVEKGVLGQHSGGIFFLMDNEILTNFRTNDVNEQNLWGNLADYGILDQFKHYAWTPSAVRETVVGQVERGKVAIVNGQLDLEALGVGEKAIAISDPSGRQLFSTKISDATFALPRINHSGLVLVTVESNGRRCVVSHLAQ
jgi:hypothetical protein